MKYILIILLSIALTGCTNTIPVTNTNITIKEEKEVPINNAEQRITKKPFGIYITPQNSPVSPERFSGYHTGIDYETFSNEQDIDIAIYAICNGKLLQKSYINGYGGVIIQSCNIDNQPVTVLYGHIKLDSVKQAIGDNIIKEEQIAILGQGFSSETDNERKHLHLSIYKGNNIELKGYVQTKTELDNWLNYSSF